MLKWSIYKIPFWAYLFVLFVLVINAFYIAARFEIPYDGACYKVENGRYIIEKVWHDTPAEKAGLQAGDIIMSVGSTPMTGHSNWGLLEPYKAGDVVTYLVQRHNTESNISVPLDSNWSRNPWFYFIFYSLLLIVSITSLYIINRKPYDPSARIFFIYLQLLAISLNFKFLFPYHFYPLSVSIAFIFSFCLIGVALLHFYLIFPEPSSIYKRHKGLLKLVYVLALLFGAIAAALLTYNFYSGSSYSVSTLVKFTRLSVGWMGLTLFAALVLAIYRFITSKSTLVLKQFRLVVAGSAIGLPLPILFSIFTGVFLKIERGQQLQWMEFINGAGSYTMTTFLAFAIFRYRIWNVEPIIRKTIFYSVVTVGVYFFYLGIVYLLSRWSIYRSDLVNYLSLIASIIIFVFFKEIIQRVIDRLFHREAYDSAAILKEFEEKITGVYMIDHLESIIVRCLNDIFHFKSFVFAVRIDNLAYKPIYLSGVNNYPVEKEFEITNEIEKLLRKTNVFAIEAINTVPEFFKISQGELVLSLMVRDHPFGFFIVGPKLSEKSYSMQDIRVLSLLAHRITSVFQTASLYQKDLDRQLMLERERTRIARDVHDDVGANLTRISILSELAKKNATDSIMISSWLQQISETSHNVILDMTQIIWALNPKNDILEGLIAYVRRFALEYLETTPVKCTFDLPEELPALALSGEVRRNIYLSIREALHNAVKHADASNILISLKMNPQGFTIMIKDDGKGFDASNSSTYGNGLINMEKRIRGVGGKLVIRTAEKQGTEISFVVPIQRTNGSN
jgi:signal transduction histidine kinase